MARGYVVRRNESWVPRFLLIVLLVVSTSAAWFWHQRTVRDLSRSERQASQRIVVAEQELSRQTITIEELQEQLAMVERSAQVKETAYREVDQHLRALQNTVAELREELAFYRGIVAKEAPIPLRLGGVRALSVGEHVHRLSVVLTRGSISDKVLSGWLRVEMLGALAGGPRRLPMENLTDGKRSSIPFKLQNFQRVTIDLVLPSGFTPQEIKILARVSEPKGASLSGNYAWSEIAVR